MSSLYSADAECRSTDLLIHNLVVNGEGLGIGLEYKTRVTAQMYRLKNPAAVETWWARNSVKCLP